MVAWWPRYRTAALIKPRIMPQKRLVYICDWLPPDFGAVGQYSMLFAREWATSGWVVTLVGLTSGLSERDRPGPVGEGTLEVIRVHRRTYQKNQFTVRAVWTVVSNVMLLRAAFAAMRSADTVIFTGSPPLMLHFIAPLNMLLRKRLIYRISDFHPECLIAERGKSGFLLRLLLALTRFWRRHVDEFEVLGIDQAKRLADSGISAERIHLKRNPSPVEFAPGLAALPLPNELRDGSGVILYSGNWGVAHDEATFIEGYAKYFAQSKFGLRCWLNATGAKADRVAAELTFRKLPVYRSSPVPLENLACLLLAADVHLITLRDSFVGYVLPSKIHACIESGKRSCSSAAKIPMFTCWHVAHCRPTGIFALTRVMSTDLQTHCMPSSARSYANAKAVRCGPTGVPYQPSPPSCNQARIPRWRWRQARRARCVIVCSGRNTDYR